MSVTISLDTSAVNELFDGLEGDIEAAVRPAAQAAAQVLYDDVKKNVGSLGRVTGNLSKAIYQAYSQRHSRPGVATYHVSWNKGTAPHGQLIEFGHLQRYAVYVGKDGHWYTAVRPGMRGKPRPRYKAPQAEKDAYYLPRPGGPVQQPARSFLRKAMARANDALAAAEAELLKRVTK